MKNSIKVIIAIAISVFLGIMSSCSNAYQPTADEVNSKILSGEELEMADYETMLDYMEEFVEEGEASPNDYESGQEVGRKYPYFMLFANKLEYAPSEMREDERYQNLSRRFVILMNR